ncbi:hypothetical protein ES1_21160 [[Eubacterium] siraeum V10Sc8a]|uniref:Uncharacterized protein n=1 Tax=[Eubacterium] siraeum V10Sc8a TaxID=717961 RepID=D4MMJ5_9FIRM|nr:hypothetical protein ES1_21160 [[Eubacterium] siraeum V10Sc8a]
MVFAINKDAITTKIAMHKAAITEIISVLCFIFNIVISLLYIRRLFVF